MPIDVTAFSAMARQEFMNGMASAYEKPMPASYEGFTSVVQSTALIETHTYMSAVPRLERFMGYNPASQLTTSTYTVKNYTYRIGPVTVKKEDLDDDQVGGYMRQIQSLPGRAQKDIGHALLAHLAAGTTNLCFDGTAFFADSHTIGSGDNLDTANFASNDGVTHYLIALVANNPAMKPVMLQNREPLAGLDTDSDTAQARMARQYSYWSDTRFGLGYGFWWDAYHVTITDTPTEQEVIETLVPQVINGFRSFTLPKGKDTNDSLYVHEGWQPTASDFYFLCNLKLGEVLRRAITRPEMIRSTGNVGNPYQNVATVIPTSALGA